MIPEKRIQKFPDWLKNLLFFLNKIRIPGKIVYILISILASIWFLVRVLPKPTRATYPCMQIAAPVMSGFVVWLLAITGSAVAFKKAKSKLGESKYIAAMLFIILGIFSLNLYHVNSDANPGSTKWDAWYKPNVPLGIAKGIFPGRVAWGHNPNIASWDGKTGFWWDDKYNKQAETDKLFKNTLFTLTNKKTEKDAWIALFIYYNKSKKDGKTGYQPGEKVAIKINMNNTSSHENTNNINANPQLVFSLLNSLITEAGVAQENITIGDPSRFVTNNVYDKCHAAFPKVTFVDHIGGDGREKAAFVENGFRYSFDFDKQTTGLAKYFVDANYVINMALMKGHVAQGVTLVSKNFFGCLNIETDWHKNAHCSGFNQSKEGKRQYSVYPDFIGHKDLGEKTILYLIDGIYGNKFVEGVPEFKWKLTPFNNQWPNSLFASQDPVAIESVVLDFALTEWPDAPDMLYSDYAMEEMALANNPPSGVVYDPERDGTKLNSLGTAEHWNNPTDKKYSRNLSKNGKGIDLVYLKIKN